ncbi:2'-5' RNA ligase family protein [Streptomyces sp. NPDC002754]
MPMDNFFERVETRKSPWLRGERHIHWHVLFDPEEVRAKLTDPYRGVTHQPGLEPVAPEWVHMTVLHSGAEEQFTKQELDAFTEGVRERAASIEPFWLTVDRPAVGTVALECVMRPGEPARELWRMTKEVEAQVKGGIPAILNSYYPHTSLAYAGARADEVDRPALKAWMSDNGPEEPVRLRAEALSLVAQWHDGREIKWELITEVPLGA